MRQIHARVIATLLWLKARYDQLTSCPYGQATFFVCLVLFGTFVIAQPADACSISKPSDCVLDMFSWIAGLIAAFLAKLIAIVIEYLIPVMLYNNFTNAPVVVAGWALVRDTVNMFFVIVLIVIAFGTIFGHKKFQWQTQVPRLLLFAIVINFSKTLAGIMIDFGQVVMLTFANALREIAAGNIIELFGLNKVNSFSATSTSFNPTSGNPGASGWDLLLASLAAVFILAWVLVIMLLLFAILLYRIVGLWVLIVTAPLAWFAGGAEILGSDAYKDWWSQFKCLVAIGPIVTFFLWLALAVAGAGSAAEGFESTTAGNSASFLTTVFEFQHFMALVVGSALIMAGMETAQKFCSSMSGGFLGKQLGKAVAFGPGLAEFGKGAALKTAGWGARKVGAGVKGAGRFAGRELGARAENVKGLKLLTQRGRSDLWRKVAQSTGSGVVGRTVGLYAQRQAAAGLGARGAEIAKAGEKYKDDSTETKLAMLQKFATNSPKTVAGKQEAMALFKDAMGNKDMQDKLRASGDLSKLWDTYGKQMGKDLRGDAKAEISLNDFRKRNADITGAALEIKSFDDVKNLSDGALRDKDVRAQLEKVRAISEKGKPITVKKKGTDGKEVEVELTAAEALRQGIGGGGHIKQAIMQMGDAGYYNTLKNSELRNIDTLDLSKGGSAQTKERFTNLALEDGNFNRIQELVSDSLDRFQTAETDEERFDISTDLDHIRGAIKVQLDSGELKGVMKAQADQFLQMMKLQREQTEQIVGGFKGGAKVSEYGKLPDLAQQADPSKFVRENLGRADKGRLEDAQTQFTQQHDGKISQRNEKQNQLQEVLKAAGTELASDVEKLNKDLAAAYEQATAKAQEKLQSLNQTAEALEQELSSKAGRGAPLEELSAVRAKWQQVQGQREQVQDEISQDPEVVRIQKEVNLKIEQQTNLDSSSIAVAKAIQEEIAKLDKDIEKSAQAGIELNKIKPVDAQEEETT